MLTSHTAYKYALEDMASVDDNGFYSGTHIDLIYEFTPTEITDEEQAWGGVLMNYWFSLAMCELNGLRALGFMEEAGVSGEAISHAFIRTHSKRYDTHVAIAPPTFKAEPKAWRNRGYDVGEAAVAGDVVVYSRTVALYVRSSWLSVACVGGFSFGKCEESTLPSGLVHVRRV